MSLLLTALLGCVDADADAAADLSQCHDASNTEVLLLTAITFARRTDGVSEGFDLDGRVSDAYDVTGCNQEDLVAPDGTPGIDNAFSGLLPALDQTEARAIESILAEFIASGELLVAVELEDVDDRMNDGCVNVNFWHLEAPVQLGTDGAIVRGQTFDVDRAVPVARAEGLALVDGQLEAKGLDIRLPVQIFAVKFDLTLANGALRVRLDPEGGGEGEMGGALDVANLEAVVDTIESDVKDLAISLIHSVADLSPTDDGTCAMMSTVVDFEATTAFLYSDAPPADAGDTGADTGGGDTAVSTR